MAAKEIDLAASELSELKQEAFITEALRLQQLRWVGRTGIMSSCARLCCWNVLRVLLAAMMPSVAGRC